MNHTNVSFVIIFSHYKYYQFNFPVMQTLVLVSVRSFEVCCVVVAGRGGAGPGRHTGVAGILVLTQCLKCNPYLVW